MARRVVLKRKRPASSGKPNKRRRSVGRRYRTFRRRAMARGINSSVRLPRPFPNSICVDLPYVEKVIFPSTTAGAADEYIYRANSAYDPNFTGAGYTPYGFVTYMAQYQRCYVISSKIKVTFLSYQTSTTTGPLEAVIYLSNVSTKRTSIREIEEVEQNRSKIVNIANNGAGNPFRSISKTFSVKKFFRVHGSAIVADDSLFSQAAANPAEVAYYHIAAASWDGSDNGNQMPMRVQMSLRCVFTDCVSPDASH